MLKIPKKITSEDLFKLLLILFWGKNFLCAYARAVLLRIPVISTVADAVIPCLVFLCFLGAYPFMSRRFTYKDLFFLLICIVAYCLNLLIYRDTYDYLWDNALSFWITVFPVYFVGLRLDKQEYFKLMYGISLLNIWLFFVYTSLFGVEMETTQSLYSGAMGRAYNLLPHILVVMVYAFKKRNLWNISTSVIASLYLFTCGTRGAVVCLFVFLLLQILLHMPFKKYPMMYLLISVMMILAMYFYEEILLWMRAMSREIGMSGRIFERLMDGSFFVSDGRNTLSSKIWEALQERIILGYGIAGDRGIVGVYVHNFALEMLISYGIPLGSVLCVATAAVAFRGYTGAKSEEIRELILVLLCAVFLKLFLSSSYLNEDMFFLMLGVCVTQIRENFPGRERKIK